MKHYYNQDITIRKKIVVDSYQLIGKELGTSIRNMIQTKNEQRKERIYALIHEILYLRPEGGILKEVLIEKQYSDEILLHCLHNKVETIIIEDIQSVFKECILLLLQCSYTQRKKILYGIQEVKSPMSRL